MYTPNPLYGTQSGTAGQPAMQQPIPAMTLTQLSQVVAGALQTHPALRGTWVAAELSDLRVTGGNCYIELIEKDAAGTTRARMRATVWSSSYRHISSKFRAVTGRDLTSGIRVMLYGAVSYHPAYGIAFNVGDIDPAYTLGDMERIRREILERLSREGVAALNRSLPVPVLPQRIAVISARGAAGYGDFIHQLENNPYGFVIYPCLFEAPMQGDRTAPGVLAALDRIEKTIAHWDCAVIIRGGGATSDLNGFDDYRLARRVCTFPIPVVVGIGHERDRTVLDELACVRCKTPTAVAAWILDTLRRSWEQVQGLTDTIVRYAADRIAGETRRIETAATLLPALVRGHLDRAHARLRAVSTSLPAHTSGRTAIARARLDALRTRLSDGTLRRLADADRQLTDFADRIADRTSRRLTDADRQLTDLADRIADRTSRRLADADRHLTDLADRLADRTSRRLADADRHLTAIASLIEALDPANTLKRGYSITRIGGKAVTDPSRIPPGALIETTLAGGTVRSVAMDTEDRPEKIEDR